MRRPFGLALAVALLAGALTGGSAKAQSDNLELKEFTIDKDVLCDIRDEWIADALEKNPKGGWAEMKFSPSNAQLAEMGLPSQDIISSRSYPKPTLVTQDGRFIELSLAELRQAMSGGKNGGKAGSGGSTASAGNPLGLPTATTYGGTGCLGIRPGALLLSVTSSSIGWCTMAHVYGTAGSYDISTAGHCGRTGDTATVIAGFGNRGDATGVVLLDFGKYATSHDGGLGNDWALIDIFPEYQSLVTPTMCFWGGPRGVYTKTGSVAALTFSGNRLIPSVSVNPDPTLAQTIVHYGHGTGIGTGGTPRVGEAIHWGSSHFIFMGVVTPGDSGSGSNTATGDAVGDTMEAVGINTHIWIDPLMRDGIGIMAGTRSTQVTGTLANGQIVPYPAPVPGLP